MRGEREGKAPGSDRADQGVSDEQIEEAISKLLPGFYQRRPAHELADIDLDMLNDELVANAKLYEAGDLADQRCAVAASLLTIHDLLGALGFSPITLAPLFRPIEALAERENNRLDPLFNERKRGGRPAASGDQHNRTGVLAALSDHWVASHPESGDLEAQLSAAARRFKGRWFGEVTKAQLKSARVLVSQEAPNHDAVMTYKHFQNYLAELAEQFGSAGALQIAIRILNIAPPSAALGNWHSEKGADAM